MLHRCVSVCVYVEKALYVGRKALYECVCEWVDACSRVKTLSVVKD